MGSVKHVRTSYRNRARFRNNCLIPIEYYKGLSSVEYYLKNGKDLETALDIVCKSKGLEKVKLSSYFYSNHSVNDIKKIQGLPVSSKPKSRKKRKRRRHKSADAYAQYYANKRRLLNK